MQEQPSHTSHTGMVWRTQSKSDRLKRRLQRRQEGDKTPIATRAILGFISVVFFAMYYVGNGDVVSVAHWFGDMEPKLIRAGQWQRLITPVFLHGSWMHLLINGLSLYWFGTQMEIIYGRRRYLLIFIVAGVTGNLLSCLLSPVPSLGASGALFGLLGAALVFPLRFRGLITERSRTEILRKLIPVILLNVAFSFVPGIDKWAHFGGFMGGAMMAALLVPEAIDGRPYNRARETALSGATAVVVMLVLTAAVVQGYVSLHEVYAF